MFLTKDEIIELTGRKFRTMQIRWLSERGYQFDINAAGNPILLKLHVEEKLGHSQSKVKPKFEPNFSNKRIFA